MTKKSRKAPGRLRLAMTRAITTSASFILLAVLSTGSGFALGSLLFNRSTESAKPAEAVASRPDALVAQIKTTAGYAAR